MAKFAKRYTPSRVDNRALYVGKWGSSLIGARTPAKELFRPMYYSYRTHCTLKQIRSSRTAVNTD